MRSKKLALCPSADKSTRLTPKKAYILDTSVLIHDPNCLNSFDDNDVFIPFVVLDEIDSLRKASNGRGRSAREAIRHFEELRNEKPDMKNVPLKNGGSFSIIGSTEDVYQKLFINTMSHDNLILEICRNFSKEMTSQYDKIALVSKDIGMRLKASSMGIVAEDWQADKIKIEDIKDYYTGKFSSHYEVDSDIISDLHHETYINLPPELSTMVQNQFIVLRCDSGSAIARRTKDKLKLVNNTKAINGIKARNAAQHMALDLLLDPSVQLVSLTGLAGSGKTLISLAAALEQTISKTPIYERILCIKPIVPVGGKDLGYLPGDKNEKLYPWLAPFFDNLEYLGGLSGNKGRGFADNLMMQNILELEAMTYMRGRSIPKAFIIIDETQNISRQEIKTALTRTGEGSKVVVLADPSQIDTPYVDYESSGIVHVVDAFKGQSIFGAVELDKSERSNLAGLAAQLL